MADSGALCPTCWGEADFIGGCICDRCGAPLPGFAAAEGDEPLACDECLALPRPWAQGRASLVYAGTGRRLVLALKHADRPDLTPALGRWLAVAVAPLVGPDTLVVPVPMHPLRLLRRKYNQAALLAAAVARAHGLHVLPAALRRQRHTPMQDHRSVADRFANVGGAITVARRSQAALTGRKVLLVDDVMASGATLSAATEALEAAGAGPVVVAVLARAVKDGAVRHDTPGHGRAA